MAVLRRVDLVLCSEQWATLQAAGCSTYSRIEFYSGWLITHGWISVGL